MLEDELLFKVVFLLGTLMSNTGNSLNAVGQNLTERNTDQTADFSKMALAEEVPLVHEHSN